jgi:alpha-ribazole phosphatase
MQDINIYLIRHGESEGNIVPDIIGQNYDVKLTEKGVSQANFLGHRFRNNGIVPDLVCSSTYLRAKTTAKIFGKIVGYGDLEESGLILTDSLVEYNPGDWKGKKRSEIYEDVQKLKDITYKHMGFLFPNGESYHQVERRASAWLEETIIYDKEILAMADKKEVHIAVFSHGQTIKCLLHYILGFDASFLWKIRIGNTSISHVVYNDKGFFLNSINDMAHLTS